MIRRIALVLVCVAAFAGTRLPGATFTAAPAILSFPSSGSYAPQTITVNSNPPGQDYTVSAAITSPGGIRWLSVSPAGDTSSGTLTVSVDPGGLPPGAYRGKINLSSGGAILASVLVNLTVNGPSNQFTITPAPASAPTAFQAAAGGANPAPLTFSVSSPTPVAFFPAATASWLSVSIAPGFTNTTPSQIVLTADATGLSGSPGSGSIYSGTVSIFPADPSYANATLATSLTLTGSPTHVNGQYSWESFDVPGASSTNPIGINNLGVISGYFTSAGRTHGFIRNVDGSFTTIDYPGASNTFVQGLNDSGQFTGYYVDATGSHGLVQSDDGVTLIGFDYPGAEGSTWSYGIDSAGNTSGVTSNLAFYRPASGFTYSPYTVVGGSLGFIPNTEFGINDFGQITGTCCGNGNTGFLSNADLSSVTFQESSVFAANAINNAGVITGYLADSKTHAYVRTLDGGTYVLLDAPGAAGTRGYGINTNGQVTGWYSDPSSFAHGYIATPTAPILAVNPAVVNITAHATGPTVTQNVIISGTGPVSFAVSTDALPSWLTVNPPIGSTPFYLSVTVDPSALDIGNYSATVMISSTTPGVNSVSFTVNAKILSPLPPLVTTKPAAFFLSYTAGGKPLDTQTLVVQGNSQGTLKSTSVTYGQGATGWLAVSPPSGMPLPQDLPVTLNLSISPVLPAGQYSALITLDAGVVDPASTTSVAVFLTVNPVSTGSPPPPSVNYSPARLDFTYQAGGAAPSPQTLSAASSGGTPVAAAAATSDGAKWLSVSPASAASPAAFTVSVDGSDLNPGSYNGTITLTSGIATSQVNVALTVTAAPLTVVPKVLTFASPANYGLSPGQSVQVSATIAASFGVLTDDGGAHWLQADLPSATAPASITVRVNTAALAPGSYQGAVNLTEGPAIVVTIPVTLNVGPPALLQISPGSLNVTYQTGDAAPAPVSIRVGAINASSAQTFSMKADGGSWLAVSGTTGTTPAQISASVSPAGLPAGTYSGTVTFSPSIAGSSPQIVPVTLQVKGAGIPTITGIANAASSVAGNVAPGEVVIISGSGLGPKAAAIYTPGANGELPQTLGATSVMFDGNPAPLIYSSDTVVIAQAPYGIARGMTNLKVLYQGITSAPKSFATAPAAPGVYTANATGSGAAAALNQDLTFNSPSNPAPRDSIIVLYATGEGQTGPKSTEGQITSVTPPYPAPVLPVSVSIGGKNATIVFAVETPGITSGSLQINATIPGDAPTGSAIPVQIAVGGVASQTGVTVSIQ